MVKATQRERLERAFETLRSQNIAAVLVLKGYPYSREERLEDHEAGAKKQGFPERYVGAHAGMQENGGAFWDAQGSLRYWASTRGSLGPQSASAPARSLLFSYPYQDGSVALALIEAVEAEGFVAEWIGRGEDCLHHNCQHNWASVTVNLEDGQR